MSEHIITPEELEAAVETINEWTLQGEDHRFCLVMAGDIRTSVKHYNYYGTSEAVTASFIHFFSNTREARDIFVEIAKLLIRLGLKDIADIQKECSKGGDA